MRKVDDTMGVIHTHGVAALVGGLGVGILADPKMIEYFGTNGDSNFSVTGAWFGNPHQFVLQCIGAAFIIIVNIIGTYILLKLISIFIPLRMDAEALMVGDDAIHAEEAYAIGGEGKMGSD
jgi:Amt family ammonium transporter